MRYLGLDLGHKSLGVSISDKLGIIASFYDNIKISNEDEMLNKVCEIISKEDIEAVVIGYPKNMNNSLGFRAEETERFKDKLSNVFSGDIYLEDERLTTKLATDVLIDADMSRRKRKKVIDGVSAVIILQSYLDRRNKNE